ncbi:zinc-dependent alcohol dehydrogenase family protein [Paenarthrobacter ureafaciens]|uniref:zinc-dependent alcohol dehydrogenase family protein n=1 Tax=Paenarthrobacter ureafaciens TaxID=37931 RepID=UPI001FB46E22|nr:zinc-dependent alcohol dehydrogenase family protein [Paenarthrobacter ureafaciens]UOD82954.1 zinc-dependent alcohol dehydrogenase family protein [Paenarthrobacter ureafaciens]WNZ02661.1 zinc-dependent alcohol dehydrogenase family protein [Paenarthrobacter ureafaciens]
MRAWWVDVPGKIADRPLRMGEREDPRPGPGEVLLRVDVCGVCRTDLHLAEGDLPPRHAGVIPGHEAVGTVMESFSGGRFSRGDRIGVAWLGQTCGHCPYCRRGQENLCLAPRFTGWDRDGGFADHMTVNEDFAYALPARFTNEQAAPLLCSGIIGYRALERAALPPGGRLGIYGFGGSAHLTAQIAISQGASVYVMTRSAQARDLALSLGAVYAGDAYDAPPVPLDSAILFAPVGDLVPVALRALDRGGTLATAGIHLTDIPSLNYRNELFYERQIRSVTANTRADGTAFLALAAEIGLAPTVTTYDFTEADRALEDLANDRVTGAAVLKMR